MNEDMTLLEVLKSSDADGVVNLIFNKYKYLCRTYVADGGRECSLASWNKYCLTSEHRGVDGCMKCRTEFLNMTMKEIQEELFNETNHK